MCVFKLIKVHLLASELYTQDENLSKFCVYISAHVKLVLSAVKYAVCGPHSTTIARTEILDRMEANITRILSILKRSIKLVFKFHVQSRTGFLIFMFCNITYLPDITMHRAQRHVNNLMSVYCTETSIKVLKSLCLCKTHSNENCKICNFDFLKSFPIHSIYPTPKLHSVKG